MRTPHADRGFWAPPNQLSLVDQKGVNAGSAAFIGNARWHHKEGLNNCWYIPESLSRVQIPHDTPQIGFTNGISLTCKVIMRDPAAGFPMLVTKGSVNAGYLIFLDSSRRITFRVNNAPSDFSILSNIALQPDKPYTITGQYDGTNRAEIWVNGRRDKIENIGLTPVKENTEPLHVGSDPDGGGNAFDGWIGSVGLFGRPLTSAENMALHFPPTEIPVVFNEPPPPPAADASPYYYLASKI